MKTRWLDKDKDLEIRKELNEKFNLYFPDKNGNKRELYDYQVSFIRELLSGYDTISILPTGAGKSVCFQLPGILIPGVTIVISPLISLITEQVKELNEEYSIKAACFFGTKIEGYNYLTAEEKSLLSEEDRKKGWFRRNVGYKEITTGDYKFLYVTPERFTSPHFIELLRRINVNFIALDEAHCVSMWGHDFRPDYAEIKRVINIFDKRPVIGAFTATASPAVQRDIAELVDLNLQKKNGKDWREDDKYFMIDDPRIFIKENHNYHVRYIVSTIETYFQLADYDELDKYEWGIKQKFLFDILNNHDGECGIIFCSTLSNIEKVYNELLAMPKYKDRVCKYTGPMKNYEKAVSAKKFKEGKNIIMVATNAFGMGIDKRDIRFVIHYNLPADIENYYQETGRAGRDGNKADCYVLFNEPMDLKNRQFFSDSGMIKGSLYFNEKIRRISLYTLLKDEPNIKNNICKYLCGETLKRKKTEVIKGENNESTGKIELYKPIVFSKDKELIEDLEEIEKKAFERKLSFPRALFANRCIIAENIRKGIYKGEVVIGRREKEEDGRKERIETVVSYELFFEDKPYNIVSDDDRITYFDMMVADAVYTLELYNIKITAKNVMIILSGDDTITLTKRKREFIESSMDRLINTKISIRFNEYQNQGLWYDDDVKNVEKGSFLPLTKKTNGLYIPIIKELTIQVPVASGKKKSRFDIKEKTIKINEISPLYSFAEKMFQFYSFRSYALNLRGKNEFLYLENKSIKDKNLKSKDYQDLLKRVSTFFYNTDDEKEQCLLDTEREFNLYKNSPDHSVENLILTHFLLRRIACLPTQKRYERFRDDKREGDLIIRKRNVLSNNILISSDSLEDNIYDYLFRGINFDRSNPEVSSRRGNFAEMDKYSRKRKMDNIFSYGGNGYKILERLVEEGIIEAFKYEDNRINLMPRTKLYLKNIYKENKEIFYMDYSLEEVGLAIPKHNNFENNKALECISKKWDFVIRDEAGNRIVCDTYNYTGGKNSNRIKELADELSEYATTLKAMSVPIILAVKLYYDDFEEDEEISREKAKREKAKENKDLNVANKKLAGSEPVSKKELELQKKVEQQIKMHEQFKKELRYLIDIKESYKEWFDLQILPEYVYEKWRYSV